MRDTTTADVRTQLPNWVDISLVPSLGRDLSENGLPVRAGTAKYPILHRSTGALDGVKIGLKTAARLPS